MICQRCHSTAYHLTQWRTLLCRSFPALLWILILALGTTFVSADDKAEALDAIGKAEAAEAKGDHAEAIRQYERGIPAVVRFAGEEHLVTAQVLGNMAHVYFRLGEFSKAEPLLVRRLKIREALLAADDLLVAASLNDLGECYRLMAQYAKAEQLHLRCLKIREAKLPADHPEVFNSLGNLGRLYKSTGQYSKAEPLLLRTLKLREEKLGADHVDVASTLKDLGDLYYHLSLYKAAEMCYQRSLKICETKLGTDHLDVAACQRSLARLYMNQAKYSEAETLYQRSLKTRVAKQGADHVDVADNLIDIANLYVNVGEYDAAEPLYQRSLAILEGKLGANHPDLSYALSNAASLYVKTARFAQAEPLLNRSLSLRETSLGAKHPDVASALMDLAILFHNMGQYAKAEVLYQRSLKIMEENFGPDHLQLTDNLNNLACLYTAMNEYTKAEPLHQRCLTIKEAAFGGNHPLVAASLLNLGELYRLTHHYAKAEPLLQRSLEILKTNLGSNHADVADSMNNLAILYLETGRQAEAEPLFQSSLKIYEAKFGKEHPNVARNALQNLAFLHTRLDQRELAAAEYSRVRQIMRKHVAQVLPVLSEKEQLTFLENIDRQNFHVALTLGWDNTLDAKLAALSAGWLANGKAVAQECLAQRAALGRDSQDETLQAIVAKLNAVRMGISKLTNLKPATGQEDAHAAQLQQLVESEQSLAKQLSRAGGITLPATWIELSDIRQNIPKGALLIDIIRFEPYIFKHKINEPYKRPAHYAAWLTPAQGEGEVSVVDLGDAEPIEKAVEEARALLANASDDKGKLRREGETSANAEVVKNLQVVSELVIKPWHKHLADKQQLILSPDGALWLLPWAALPVAENKCLLEQCSIRYVTSGRDLVRDKSTNKLGTMNPAIVVNPAYDLAGTAAKAAIRTVLPEFKIDENATRGETTRSSLPRVAALPFTSLEGAAAKPSLEQLAKSVPVFYEQEQALETVVKKFQRPKHLLLSTHGFFLPDQKLKSDDKTDLLASNDRNRTQAVALTADGKPFENPLLRCGLLLAGCNAPRTPGLDDGILTGLEIVGMDLRGTELVVLSACETGIGKVRNGEGVAGLRQAFQLAGAQSVVSTLWQVPDRDSAIIMQDFFTNLAAGQSKADALRNAQLKRIAARKDKSGAAHPFFWAAWTVTGD